MRLYPDVPNRRFRSAMRDGLFLLGLLALAWLGKRVHDDVDRLAVIGEGLRKAGGSVPFVGDPVEGVGRTAENDVHHLANVLGGLFFVIPAVAVCCWYLPRRAAQIRKLTDAARVLLSGEERLVAMRAAFSLPYAQLLAYSRDPLGDLEAGRYEPLVSAALEDAGLRRQRLSDSAAPRPSSTMPATRAAPNGIFSSPKRP